jgi:hypothetical protein
MSAILGFDRQTDRSDYSNARGNTASTVLRDSTPPVVPGAPTPQLRRGEALPDHFFAHAPRLPVTIVWSATDDSVKKNSIHYELQGSVDGSAYRPWPSHKHPGS